MNKPDKLNVPFRWLAEAKSNYTKLLLWVESSIFIQIAIQKLFVVNQVIPALPAYRLVP